MQLAPSAGKINATIAKRGKTCNRRKARESVQQVSSLGKYATYKQQKNIYWCEKRKHVQLEPGRKKVGR